MRCLTIYYICKNTTRDLLICHLTGINTQLPGTSRSMNMMKSGRIYKISSPRFRGNFEAFTWCDRGNPLQKASTINANSEPTEREAKL